MKAFWIYTSDKAKESLVSDVCWIGENIRNTSVSFDSFLSVQLYGPKYIYIAMQTSPPSTSWTFPCSPIPTKHQLPIPFLPAFGNHHCILCLNEFDYCAAAAAKSLQSCPTMCDPVDGSPPGSPVPGILQARTLEWGAISFTNEWKWKVKVKSLSRVRLFETPWTVAYQAPLCMGFSRQEYWSGVPLPSPLTTLGNSYR